MTLIEALRYGVPTQVPDLPKLSIIAPAEGPTTQAFGVISVTGIRHNGLDYSIPAGTPVRAILDGEVVMTRTVSWPHYGPIPPDYHGVDTGGGGYGNYVVLAHNAYQDDEGTWWAIRSMYAHFESLLVFSGERVVQGQIIGYSDSTGISTGDHLHWEVRRGDDYTRIDPARLINREVDDVTPEQQAILDKAGAFFAAFPDVTPAELAAQVVTLSPEQKGALLGELASADDPAGTSEFLVIRLNRQNTRIVDLRKDFEDVKARVRKLEGGA